MVPIPDGVEQIDPDWLRAAIRPCDAVTFSGLTSIDAERLGENTGMLTRLYRLHLGYAADGNQGPATLVAKLPSDVPEVLEIARAWRLYQREAVFYAELSEHVGLRVPKAYVSQFNPQTHHFALVMEDMAPAVNGDQVAGLSLEHVQLALKALADLHARWWSRAELVELEGAIQPFGEGPWEGTGERLAAAWPAFKPFVEARASAALLRVGDRMAVTIERQMLDVARAPRTLCHGDFRADNLMFAEITGEEALVTIDWQVALQARGAVDVSQLLSISVSTDLRRTHERELLKGYHDRLVANGVTGYGYEEFVEDYRRGLLIGFFYVILSGGANDVSEPRVRALYDCAVRRLDAIVEDHDLETLVN